MQAALKPASAVTKKRATPKTKAAFLCKKHKRKGGSGDIFVFAIYDNVNGKQISQLSSNVTPQSKEIVDRLVSELNEGEKTPADVIAELNQLKGSA